MRLFATAAAAFALAACSPAGQAPADTQWDMGPMPPVAALYDQATPPDSLDARRYYLTDDLAEALSAPDTPVDFDYRTWANDPGIENQTFGLSESSPDDRMDVVTRFTYPGVGGGMILTYTTCRLGPSDWRIEDISAVFVPDDDTPMSDDPLPSLRTQLSLPPRSPTCG
jgi:hypothetical protein